jgi:hypothetical protein
MIRPSKPLLVEGLVLHFGYERVDTGEAFHAASAVDNPSRSTRIDVQRETHTGGIFSVAVSRRSLLRLDRT